MRTLPLFATLGLVAIFTPTTRAQSAPAPLSLEDAISQAIAENPQMSSAHAGEREAAAKVKTARSGLMPRIGAAEIFTESTDPVFAFGARLRQGRFSTADFAPDRLNYPAPTADYSSSASASWMLFDAGRTRLQVASARKSLSSSREQTVAAEQNTAFETVRAYYRALLSDQESAAMVAAVARAQAFAKDAHDRVAAGTALEADGMEADVALAQRRQEQAQAQSNRMLAYADLGGILGDPEKTYALIPPAGTPPDLTATLEELQHQALQGRPDLIAAHQQMEAAEMAVKAGHRAFGPQVSTFANVQADNPHPLGGGNDNWTAGAKVELNLFDGGARRAELDQASAQLQTARAQYREAETKAVLQLKQAFFARQNAAAQYATSASMLQQAQETLRTATDRYSVGLVLLTEVLREQEQLRDMELNRAQSLYEWWIADAQVRLAAGTMAVGTAGGRP